MRRFFNGFLVDSTEGKGFEQPIFLNFSGGRALCFSDWTPDEEGSYGFAEKMAVEREETMSPITHCLIGWMVANSVPSLDKRERALVTWASVIPDIDGVGLVAELVTSQSSHPLTWWSDYHHILGHNLGFALLVAVLFAMFARHRLLVACAVFLSFHLHLLGDLIGARGPDGNHWPMPYLLPFSNRMQLAWSGQWALNAWPNVVITVILLSLSLEMARRRGFSPVELFSAKADSAVVAALRRRFPLAERTPPPASKAVADGCGNAP